IKPQNMFISPYLDGLYPWIVSAADGAVMDVRKMTEIHEIFETPGSAGFPVIRIALQHAVASVVEFWENRYRKTRLGQRYPDDAARFSGMVAPNGYFHSTGSLCFGGNAYTCAMLIKSPAMIRTFDSALDYLPQRQIRSLMGTAAVDGGDLAIQPGNHDILAEQAHANWLVQNLAAIGDRMPIMLQGFK